MRRFFLILLIVVLIPLLSACASGNDNASAKSVEDYLTALVEKDANRLSTLSCGDWEDDALLELDSIQNVTARLEGMSCEQTGSDGSMALVNCSGKIILTYTNEDQEIDLGARTFEVVQEAGEWLVCGAR